MAKISIIGLGWLGEPLAISLKKQGHSVAGSTTTLAKIDHFRALDLPVVYLKITATGIEGSVAPLLKNIDVLVVAIPPKLRGDKKENYIAKMALLQKEIEQYKVPKVIFVSSTSVYGDAQGEVTEQIVPKPDTESGKQLWETEQLLTQKNTTIIRFGGLIGADRNPIKMLSGRANVAKPNAVVNLIHQEDCIAIISKIIETNTYGISLNAVNPSHPSRKAYYFAKAKEYNLPEPLFNENETQFGKQVDSVFSNFYEGIVFKSLL